MSKIVRLIHYLLLHIYIGAANSVLGNVNDFIAIVNIVNNNSLTRGQNGRWHGRPHRCKQWQLWNLNTSSQPNVWITRSSNKRSNPESPDSLPATQKQTLWQIRRRNYVGDLRDLGTNKKTPVSRKNIIDKVLDALTSPDVLNKIMPILSEKMADIHACVDSYLPIKRNSP